MTKEELLFENKSLRNLLLELRDMIDDALDLSEIEADVEPEGEDQNEDTFED